MWEEKCSVMYGKNEFEARISKFETNGDDRNSEGLNKNV